MARVVIASLMREHGGTGLQTHVLGYRDHLLASGAAVRLVTPFSSGRLLAGAVFGVRRGLAPLSGTASVRWYRHWHAAFLARSLRRELARGSGPAVVYAQCPVSAEVALRVRTDQPVVMVAHFNLSQADEWADKGEIARDGATYAAIRALEEQVLPRLDGVVHVSAFTRTALEERIPALRDVPSVVVPNFVSVVPRPPRARSGDLVTVGALEPRKNQAHLLDVLAAAAELGHRPTLTVVGDGPDRSALERRAARLGLGDRVRFTGHLDDPRPAVARHRLYVHTARQESFGVALIEAMAEGLPVLATAVGGVPEVVRPGLDGAFWPLDDPAAAAEVLVALLDDPDRLARLGAGAADRARTAFGTDVVAPRLTAFLTAARVRAAAATNSPAHR